MESYQKLKPTTSNTQTSSIHCVSNHMMKSNKIKDPKWIAPSTHPYKIRKRDDTNEISKLESRKRTAVHYTTFETKARRLNTLMDGASASKSDTSSNVDCRTSSKRFSKQVVKNHVPEDLASLKDLSTVERTSLLQPFGREDDIKIIMYFHKNLHLLTLKNKNLVYKQLEMKYCFGKSADFLRRRFIDEILPNVYHYNCLSLEEIIVFYDKADMVVPQQVRSIIQQKVLTTKAIDISAPTSTEVEGTTSSRSQILLRESKSTTAEANYLKPNCNNPIRKKIQTNAILLNSYETSKENEIAKTVHTRLNDQLDIISNKQAATHQSNEIIPNENCAPSETARNEKSSEILKTGSNTNCNKINKHLEMTNNYSIKNRFKTTKLSVESKVASKLDVPTSGIVVNTREIQIYEKGSSDEVFSDDTIILEASSSGKKSTANVAGQISNKKTLGDGGKSTEKPIMKSKSTQLHLVRVDEDIDISYTESDLIVLKIMAVTHIFTVKENPSFDVKQVNDHYHTGESNIHVITRKEFEILKMCAKYKILIENLCIAVTATVFKESAVNQNEPESYNLDAHATNTIKSLYKKLETKTNIHDCTPKDIGIKKSRKKYHSQRGNKNDIATDIGPKQIQENTTQTTSASSGNIESINNYESISEKVVGENIPRAIDIASAKNDCEKSSNQLIQTQPPLTEQNETVDSVKQINPNKTNSASDTVCYIENNLTKLVATNETVQQTVNSYKESFLNFLKEINCSAERIIPISGRNNTNVTDSSHVNVDQKVNQTVRPISTKPMKSTMSNYACGRLKFIKPKYTYSRKPKPPVSVEQKTLESPNSNVHNKSLQFDLAQPSTSKSNDFICVSDNSSHACVPPHTFIKSEHMEVNIPDPIFETLEDTDTKLNSTNNSFSTISNFDSTSSQINNVISNLEISGALSSTSENASNRNSQNEEDALDRQGAEEIKREPLNDSVRIKQELISGEDSNDMYSEMIFDCEIVKEEISILESISNEIGVPNRIFPIAMSRKMKAYVAENHSNLNHLKPIWKK